MTKSEAILFLARLKESGDTVSIDNSENEIAGKLAKNKYDSFEWDACKPGWHYYAPDFSGYMSRSSVLEILATGEDWEVTDEDIDKDD